MNKTMRSKKLRLSPESLRRLSGEDLGRVNGGVGATGPNTEPCGSLQKGCTQPPCNR